MSSAIAALLGTTRLRTLCALSSHHKLIDSLIEQHHGRFVNSAGDSVLAEFASVVNAVQCAVEVQTTLKAENAPLSPERRMEFRIGVNLGDVMVDGEQIYGDGVNVPARLESLAQAGGICISRTVHDQIKNKLALNYEDLGEQTVKNIADPVRVFRVLAGVTPTNTTPRVARKYVRRGAFSIAGLTIIAATVVLVQHLSLRPPGPSASIPSVQIPRAGRASRRFRNTTKLAARFQRGAADGRTRKMLVRHPRLGGGISFECCRRHLAKGPGE